MEVSRSPQSRRRGVPILARTQTPGSLGTQLKKKIMLMGKKEQQEQSSHCKSLHDRRASYPETTSILSFHAMVITIIYPTLIASTLN